MSSMKTNVGGWDRVVRIVAGVTLLSAGAAGYAGRLVLAFGPMPQVLTSVIVALIGLVLLLTGVTGSCTIYRLLGMDTG